MSAVANALTQVIWSAIGGDKSAVDSLSFTGGGVLPSIFPVTDFASAAIGAAALSVVELLQRRRGKLEPATVDRRLSSFWFGMSIRPIGWKLPPAWDPIAGDYRARDGWIRLHTNAPHHRAAAQLVLGTYSDRDGMARAVQRWSKGDLEKAIVGAGGCAAEMRTITEWAEHPQSLGVASEPLAHVVRTGSAPPPAWAVPASRPLKGLKVLDLTRVLAGPVASRFLAGYGADVLRIDPPGWDEPGVVPEVTLGKRCARLDLHRSDHRGMFEMLLSQADIFVHGYRPGALDRLGFDPITRRTLSPGLIDVCLDAYGWSGPAGSRRGFDSLVQMSTGIADAGMRWRGAYKPTPLPVQALDHATGYLMAAVAVRGVTHRLVHGNGTDARLSLAQTAKLLVEARAGRDTTALAPETSADLLPTIEETDWGQAQRLNLPLTIDGSPMFWDLPARKLGSAGLGWR